MTDDDDSLAAFDLSAWEAPPPITGLADAVVARARQPEAAIAHDVASHRDRSRRRVAVGAGAVIAVAVLAIILGTWGVQRAPKDGQGEVIANAAQSLAIGPTTAQLDVGARVRWRRERRRITVTQPRGSASWSVAADDSIVIDAGAMVASVEASGASLRVEVEMLDSRDARSVGFSAATAVAVALVTIVVYEGRVVVRHDGETTHLSTGGRLELRPKEVADASNVGGRFVGPRVQELEAETARLRKELEALRADPKVPAALCDEVSCVLANDARACCAAFKPCDAGALRRRGDGQLATGNDAAALAAFEASMTCRPDDSLLKRAFLAACRSKNQSKSKLYYRKLPAAQAATLAQVCLRMGIDPTVAQPPQPPVAKLACDADALRKEGDDHLATGMDAAALAAYEQSLKCRPDPSLHKKAFLAACRSNNEPKAKLYYAKLPANQADSLAQMCRRVGIDPAPAAPLDPTDAPAQKGATPTKAPIQHAQAPCQLRGTYDMNDGGRRPACAGGLLEVLGPRDATIQIDGKDTQRSPPASFELPAGRHRVTYVIAGNRYTFAMVVRDDAMVTLSKHFE